VVDRERLRAVQTPQGFRREVLTRAVKRAAEGGLETTDDAALVEALGQPVHLVPGERTNLKLTVPEDVPLIEALLPGEGSRAPAFRVGFGYDIHRFSAERPLVLGGVRLRESDGLEGHSDADVVLHAVCDALLGAAALGDIGQHFSDTDPRWKGADSRVLLGHVAELVHQAGWSVGNLDVTVLCERPKIMPHAAAMREAIALSAGCATSQVNLKATTLEGLGALGQCEGIAAQAVGMLVRSHR
jgi:2-C-methyl-D-erythritol 4-phosphate cytidylyltransferase / 2-C-methyl-D-erythritol 2,4-cyclodiphosphate synthase